MKFRRNIYTYDDHNSQLLNSCKNINSLIGARIIGKEEIKFWSKVTLLAA